MRFKLLRLSFAFALVAATSASADALIVQSTTSTANSGFYDHILPEFEKLTGIEVRVVAVGTGQAIRNAENCDGDVLLVHAREAEERFVAAGGGLERFDLMYNDFLIVGPSADPAGLGESSSVQDALKRIMETTSLFASRGDDSGTHKKELGLWDSIGFDPSSVSGSWYRETGSGMGATLNAGIGMEAYILTDRATWVTFGNKQQHSVLVEGDPLLFNQYGIIAVNPEKCSNARVKDSYSLIHWLTSESGQAKIAAFRVNGEQLFVPNAKATD